MLKRIFFLVIGAAVIFSLERGAELMWPDVSAWTWWSVALFLLVAMLVFSYGPAVTGLAGNRLRKTMAASPEPPTSKEERVFTKRSAVEILEQLKNWTTTMDMQQFAQLHVGKWMRVQHHISDIGISGDTIFVIVGMQKFGPMVRLSFLRKRWQLHLESMDKGDRIAAEGMIVNIEYPALYLGNCELVDEREEDDAF